MIQIGTVSKAQGIKGEIKFNLEIAPERILNLNCVFINDKSYEVEKFENRINGFFVKLKNVNSRNDAEKLRNFQVFVEENELQKLSSNEFYFQDLIDAEVCDENDVKIGQIVDIDQFGAADVIYILENGIIYSVPFTNDIFIRFNKTNKIFYINKEKYDDMKIFD